MVNLKRIRISTSLFVLFTICAVSGRLLAFEPPGWSVTQITDNITNELNPLVSEDNVIWNSNGAIYFWDGLIDTYIDMGELAHISGSNVTWYDLYLGNLEIFLWDGATITILTTNLYEDKWPFISGDNIVWTAKPDGTGTDREIFFHDGTTTTRVTNNANDDGYSPTGSIPSMDISGDNIVWEGSDGTDQEIFFWDSTTNDPGTIVQVTANTSEDMLPQISGSNIVWQGHDGNDYEIFFWDGATTTQITNNTFDDRAPKISGSNVTWSGYDGNDNEIFFWDGATTTQITNNSYSDNSPRISGTNITWSGYDGSDYEIFLWDGTRTILFTENNYADLSPQISDSLLAWQGYDGNDYEIFTAAEITLPPNTDIGDISGDGITTIIDARIFFSHWLDSNCTQPLWCEGSDYNHNGTTDMDDLVVLCSEWDEVL